MKKSLAITKSAKEALSNIRALDEEFFRRHKRKPNCEINYVLSGTLLKFVHEIVLRYEDSGAQDARLIEDLWTIDTS